MSRLCSTGSSLGDLQKAGIRVMGRQSEPGPAPGTHIITIEIPKELDDEQAYGVYVAISEILRRALPGTYSHWHRVMENKGKHGNDNC